MKRPITIGMDCDGVLRDFPKSLVETYKMHYPKHDVVPVKEWDKYSLDSYFPVGKDIYKFFTEEHPLSIYSMAQPYPGVRGQLSELKEKYRVVIVSYQPTKHIEDLTREWLRNYGLQGATEIFIKDKSKVEGLDVLIDDCTENLQAVRKAATTTIPMALDRPWNQDWDGVRIHNIKEAHEIIGGLRRDGFFD